MEVLFQLAQILGVSTEELMNGQYMHTETLAPQAIEQTNERYTHLTKVDSYNTTGIKWRRLLAWTIDWNIIGLSVILLASIASAIFNGVFHVAPQTFTLVFLFIMLMYPICFVLRDWIFGGRSIGKRIMGLVVLDQRTGMTAQASKCILRNLFLFIVHIDTVFLLASGATLGDRAAHTVIVRKKVLDSNGGVYKITEINQYSPPKKTSSKKFVFIVVAIISAIFAITFIALSAAKNTEEYAVAYDYFVQSQTFAELGVNESKIWSNKYSLTTHPASDSNDVTHTAQIGFIVRGKSFEVICHKQNDIWFVCDECTKI